MGISILSYNGSATLAVIADAHLVPDPESITAAFNREFAGMLSAVRQPATTTTTVRRRSANASRATRR
jgi:hypothetical protein